jgi:phosphopantothenoylcysteine decarboxylase / phosphopantothenate---cysteine ligase
VANDVTAPGAGFGHDTNAALLLDAGGTWTDIPLTTKRELASSVLDVVARLLSESGLSDNAGGSP